MYDLDIDSAINKIIEEDSKLVCIQLPDGLKNKADIIQKEIESRTDAKVIIWAGTCFGSCDLPIEVKRLGVDLLIQWGHSY